MIKLTDKKTGSIILLNPAHIVSITLNQNGDTSVASVNDTDESCWIVAESPNEIAMMKAAYEEERARVLAICAEEGRHSCGE